MADVACPCGCGRTYSDPELEAVVKAQVAELGVAVTVTIVEAHFVSFQTPPLRNAPRPPRSFQVPRHYIALHGLKAWEVPELAVKHGWPELQSQ